MSFMEAVRISDLDVAAERCASAASDSMQSSLHLSNNYHAQPSPLQALVIPPTARTDQDCQARLSESKRHLPFSFRIATCRPSVNTSPKITSITAVLRSLL
jgi:hypothetical protein